MSGVPFKKKGDLQLKKLETCATLCPDSKILSKVLASTLGKAMKQVVHAD